VKRLSYLAASAVLLTACARGGGADAGAPRADAGSRDAGPTLPGTDAAVPGIDAAVPGVDAAVPGVDAAVPRVDAGSDAGGPSCVGVDCSSFDGPCQVGVCDSATGACSAMTLTDGATCDDGVVCTTSMCASGSCVGAAIDCSSMDSTCATGMCDPATDACVAMPIADGTSCDTDATDCMSLTCQAGTCATATSPDCSACSVGGGTFCSAGTCGAGSTSITYDFESGLPPGWTVGGDAGWVVDATQPHGGTLSAGSGPISHNDTSSLFASFNFATAVTISNWVYTSTESCCDHLIIFVDGVEQNRWSGTTAWTRVGTTLSAGPHMVEWRYDKDSSVSTAADRVYIDDVVIQAASPAEDFEAAGLPAGYTTSGDANWFVSSAQAHGGTMSAESGDIDHSQETNLFYSANYAAAGNVSFWRRVSSESTYDSLEFYIDGSLQDSWAGSLTTWTRETYAVSAGSHMLHWRYEKDSSVSSGADTVWIDDIVATDAVPAGSICGP